MDVRDKQSVNVLSMDASTLARHIKEGRVSSAQATEEYIQLLKNSHSKINALVEDRFMLARQEAKAADEAVASGTKELGKLHGVPVSIKECFHVKGMRTTGGLSYRKDRVQEEDAESVARLKREGAIVLGKTNTPALCFCQETENKLYGRTNNPWDVTRTVGGSSGGEGALIAVGGAAVGLGADIGGSIRFPSHYNGVVGFKSGRNQVSPEGHFPSVTLEEQLRMLGIGAMAKSVQDARLIHGILSDHAFEPAEGHTLQLVIPRKHDRFPLSPEMEAGLERLTDDFSQEMEVLREYPPLFDDSTLIWQQIMSMDGGETFASQMSEGGKDRPLVQYVKEMLFRNTETHNYLSWALIGARMFKPSRSRLQQIMNQLAHGDEVVRNYLEHRLLLLPVYHRGAQPHGKMYKEVFSLRKTFMKYMPYIAYANVWGLPSLTVPLLEDQEGLPMGIQIIGYPGKEEQIFQLGEKIEQRYRGYKRCEQYDN
jgi:fatty acid amide hydrolase 2